MIETAVKLNVKNVLMDVDGTMTEEKENWHVLQTPPHEILTALLMKKHKISRGAALKLINAAGDINVMCLFDLLDKLEIPKGTYWNLVKNDIKKYISIPEDVVYFIKDLKAKGIKLFSATTNSRMMTLLKMSINGLATIDGSPYMSGFFSGNSFNDPKGKFSENFFPSIIKHGGFDPDTTMMIGNEIERDLEPALKTGIKHVVIIDKKQALPLVYRNRGIFVNSLKIISDML